MDLFLLGINHKKAPLEIREKVSFTQEQIPLLLKKLTSFPEIEEALVLSTCNRSEFYLVASDINGNLENIKKLIFSKSGLNLSPYLYEYKKEEAVSQILRVAAGIDSMIIGEGGIFYQVKKSLETAHESSTTGPILNTLFRLALSVGKRARRETNISKYTSSLSFSAVLLSKKIFSDLSKHKILLIGAGKTSELTAKYLVAEKVKCVFVANRTYERACELAEKFNAEVVKFDEVLKHLNEVDIIITSTDAPHYVLKYESLKLAMKLRKNRPLFIIDLAMPRDVDPHAEKIEGIFLYNIDDLGQIVENNLNQRREEIPMVEKIILQETQRFLHWFEERKTIPLIHGIKEKAEVSRKKMMEKISLKNSINTDELAKINRLSSLIIKKALHPIILKVKNLGHGKNEKTISSINDFLN
jgi:glutamyl-tRNA reductase